MVNLYAALACLLFINLIVFYIGFIIFSKKVVWPAWLILSIVLLIVFLIFIPQGPVFKMLALISTTFSGLKVVVTATSYQLKNHSLSFKQWFFFCFGWAGMQPQLFEKYGTKPIEGGWSMIGFGLTRLGAGVLMIIVARQVIFLNLSHQFTYLISSILLLIAFSLILHFGVLSISAGQWRLVGINAGYLFKSPLKSKSLTEFWSKRWNIAFSEMTVIAIFRPLRNKIGNGSALLLGFAFSGALHELALSVPVGSGYGMPMLYFILHGCLVMLEKTLINKRILILQRPVIAKVWVFFWLIVPMPLLFHHAFITQVLWPMAGFSLK